MPINPAIDVMGQSAKWTGIQTGRLGLTKVDVDDQLTLGPSLNRRHGSSHGSMFSQPATKAAVPTH
jgi:hypothetical protein